MFEGGCFELASGSEFFRASTLLSDGFLLSASAFSAAVGVWPGTIFFVFLCRETILILLCIYFVIFIKKSIRIINWVFSIGTHNNIYYIIYFLFDPLLLFVLFPFFLKLFTFFKPLGLYSFAF